MTRVARSLKAAWYGPLAGLLALAFILFVPAGHHCWGILGARGSASGIYCSWSTPLAGSSWISLAVVALAVLTVLGIQLLSTNPRFLVAVGLLTVAFCVVALIAVPNYNVAYWASVHDLEYTDSDLQTTLLLMLPSGLLPLYAGLRRLRRQSREAAASS
jgi:hypothetical protein